MVVKVAINGFGRVGRQVLKALLDYYPDKYEVVAINDLLDAKTNAHLFKYDSNYGVLQKNVSAEGDKIIVGDKEIGVYAERDPSKLPWSNIGVDVVVESTGVFTDAKKASAHINAGAKKVVITAPAKNEDITIVMGVNEGNYEPDKHHIISNASCTTNCLAPVCKVLQDNFGIQSGFMTTIHAYTNDQRILDLAHKDLRRARAAAVNMVPTTTGAAKAIFLVIPELKGKLHGIAIRVPITTVSLIDLAVKLEKTATADAINDAFKTASETDMKGILSVCNEPLVSSDFKATTQSAIIDGLSTMVIDDIAKVLAWYDNEWAYACRVADLIDYISTKGIK
jgi:glyceraldehyde 3-phosphate dehydrogenase